MDWVFDLPEYSGCVALVIATLAFARRAVELSHADDDTTLQAVIEGEAAR